MSSQPIQPELRDFLGILWLRKWWIVGAVLIAGGLSYARTASQPDTYVSQSEVLVLPVNLPQLGYTTSAFVFMPNEVQIASSATVADLVAKKVEARGLQPAGVSITNPTDTQTIDFVARSTDPKAAQATAQGYADSYLFFRRDNLLSSIDSQLSSINDLIARLEARLVVTQRNVARTSDPNQQQALQIEIASLSNQIQDQQQRRNDLELASNTPVGQVLQPAYMPTYPASPRPRRAAILGLVIGLVLGIGLAFLRDRLDQRIRGRDDIETIAGASVLGQIPNVPALHRHLAVRTGGDVGAAEAFRSLRTRLTFATSHSESKTIMITSARLGEGKTTTAANLAVALAQADVDVVLVSADLRRPGLQRYFPQSVGLGVADVLNGRFEIGEVAVRTSLPHLVIVPSGTSTLAPEAGLGTNVMLAALTQLAQEAGIVIIDAPPVLGVSESLDLASLVDEVILVVDGKGSRKDAVAESVRELRSVGASVLGVVVTRFDPDRFSPHYPVAKYGYGPTEHPRESGDGSLYGHAGSENGEPDAEGRTVPARGDARTGSGPSDG